MKGVPTPVSAARRDAWPGLSRLHFEREGPRPDAAPLEVRDPCYQLARIIRLGRALPFFDDNNSRVGTWFDRLSEDPTARLALVATEPPSRFEDEAKPLPADYLSLLEDCIGSDGCFDPTTRRTALDQRADRLIDQAGARLGVLQDWINTRGNDNGSSGTNSRKDDPERLAAELAALHKVIFWGEAHPLPQSLQRFAASRLPKEYGSLTGITAPDQRRSETARLLLQCLAAIDALDAGVRNIAVGEVRTLIQKGGAVAPHIALILAFIAMYDRVAEELNGLPARYMHYLYRDWLGLRPAAPVADKVDVVLGATEDAGGSYVPAGTRFEGGTTAAGKPIQYALADPLFLSTAKLVEIESLSVAPNALGTLEGNRIDRTAAKTAWPFLSTDPEADETDRFGFILSGRPFNLPAGRKQMTVTLSLEPASAAGAHRLVDVFAQNGVSEHLPENGSRQTLFEVSCMSSTGLLPLPDEDVTAACEARADGRLILTLCLTLPAVSAPPKTGEPSAGPGLQFLTHRLAQGLAAPEFTTCAIKEVAIGIEATGITELYEGLQQGQRIAATLAAPFGAPPKNKGAFTVWTPIFEAGYSLSGLRFSWNWTGMPDSLIDYFAHYYRRLTRSARDRRPYAMRLIASDATGEPVMTGRANFDGGRSAAVEAHAAEESAATSAVAGATLTLETPPFAFGHDLYGQMLAEASRQDRRWHPIRWLRQSVRAFVHAFIIPVVIPVSDRAQPLALGLERKARLAPLTLLRRFIRYRRPPEHLKVPQPCSFQMQNLTLDLSGLLEADLNDPASPVTLQHVGPGGRVSRLDFATLMPRPDRGHEVRLGFSGLDVTKPLSLLFDLPFVDMDCTAPDTAVEWSVLDGETWRPLDDTERGLDHTANLTRSGALTLHLPATRSDGLYWLRALVRGDQPVQRRCAGIHVNGARLDHAADTALPDAPPLKGTVKRLAKPSSAVTSVQQPYASYGGKSGENLAHFAAAAARRLRSRNRNASAHDIEHAILAAFPSIERAKCIPATRPDGARAAGHLLIVVASRPAFEGGSLRAPVPPPLCDDIRQMVAIISPMGAEVHVMPPRYQPVTVDTTLELNRYADPIRWEGLTIKAINRAIADAALTDGGLRLGGSLDIDPVRKALMGLSFISAIPALSFRSPLGDANTAFVTACHPGAVLSPSFRHRMSSTAEQPPRAAQSA
ncbi:baseplate J/gp47 family protein [Pseudokordiimonas caeni]|uniref:baseplate J/gp47 family protein n=1 Tax=Pseudokordiimonas caeni TaxID=2997908 RepID=UPI0028128D93|nr:baseplate J/gp47 family protein [Pseudokordiimonas caeni]